MRTVVSGRAELVGDVGDKPLLHLRERGQLGDLFLQAGGHVVEGGAEPGDLVLALDHHAFLQLAGGELFGDDGGVADRADDVAGDVPGDGADQEHQDGAAGQQDVLDLVEGLLEISRFDAGAAVLDAEPTTSSSSSRTSSTVSSPVAAEYGSEIALSAPAGASSWRWTPGGSTASCGT